MSTLLVSAAVVLESGRVLLTRRKSGTHLAGLWEFPGGKVEPDEDPRDALRRELVEELGIDCAIGDIVDVAFHRYPDADRSMLLLFYEATRSPSSAEPQPLDVAEFRWAEASFLTDERFPAADLAVLRKVRARLTRGTE